MGAPPTVSAATMSGCTWHTVNQMGSPQRPVALSISQHLPPQSPSSGNVNPLSALTQQLQMAIMMGGGSGLEGVSASQLTEVLLSTVSGIKTLRAAVGDNVMTELLSLLLKDGRPPPPRTGTDPHLPLGLLDN